ncbi:hypothetical protein EYC80_004503 [Monilinia laxa]|uniref:Post-SET domain-containing protein n=1 Tax=Monilinia laxa TaxID=61186 RepID=A0A5N6KIH8_MONLA|nr:hypothetical protein EYC80_004503 [Monilinia laxa]
MKPDTPPNPSRKFLSPPSPHSPKWISPPCTPAPSATYATVQTSPTTHLNLNSDLLYINHSCTPSLIFDVENLTILVGPAGLRPGQDLTFFYPSTEWHMSQAFSCNCGTADCVGEISGAGQMKRSSLEGRWLSGYIRRLLEEREREDVKGGDEGQNIDGGKVNGAKTEINGEVGGEGENSGRRGITSREMSGEMGGDTL